MMTVPAATEANTYTVPAAFEQTEDRVSMMHETSYSLVDITDDLYFIRELQVLDNGMWKNLMVNPFLQGTCVYVEQMTQAVGMQFATVKVEEGQACEVRVLMFKQDEIGSMQGSEKTFYFEWTVGSPVTCVPPAYMGTDGNCQCNNNWQLNPMENNVFSCIEPTCDFAPNLQWNSLFNTCVCQNGGNLVGTICENPCHGGSITLGGADGTTEVCICDDAMHYYMWGAC
jgi:hypothetical protein